MSLYGFEYIQNKGVHSLFIKHAWQQKKKITTYRVYVDDLIVIDDDNDKRDQLVKEVEIKDLV